MGLVNEDMYTAQNGVSLANTYVELGTDTVYFSVNKADQTYSAATTMYIYKDAQAAADQLQPVECRHVSYNVPDPSAVYELLYASAKVSEGWGNTNEFLASTLLSANTAATSDNSNTAPTSDATTSNTAPTSDTSASNTAPTSDTSNTAPTSDTSSSN